MNDAAAVPHCDVVKWFSEMVLWNGGVILCRQSSEVDRIGCLVEPLHLSIYSRCCGAVQSFSGIKQHACGKTHRQIHLRVRFARVVIQNGNKAIIKK